MLSRYAHLFSRRMRLVYPNLIDSICILTSRETHFFHRIYCFTTFIHLFKDTSRTEMIWRVWVYRIDEVYFNLFYISLSINCGTTRRTKANAATTNIEYNQLMKSFIGHFHLIYKHMIAACYRITHSV